MKSRERVETCPIDGRELVVSSGPGRPRRYCSVACRRQAAWYRAALPELRASLAEWRRMRPVAGALSRAYLARMVAQVEAHVAIAERVSL